MGGEAINIFCMCQGGYVCCFLVLHFGKKTPCQQNWKVVLVLQPPAQLPSSYGLPDSVVLELKSNLCCRVSPAGKHLRQGRWETYAFMNVIGNARTIEHSRSQLKLQHRPKQIQWWWFNYG